MLLLATFYLLIFIVTKPFLLFNLLIQKAPCLNKRHCCPDKNAFWRNVPVLLNHYRFINGEQDNVSYISS